MRKTTSMLAALTLALGSIAPALAVTITPDFHSVWVPWEQCVQVSVSTTQSYTTYEWTYDGTISGSSQNFTVPEQYCNPGFDYTWYEDHTVAVYVTGGGQASYDSLPYTVYYEPGNENGGCGTQIICDP
jgi:hypothetical protein